MGAIFPVTEYTNIDEPINNKAGHEMTYEGFFENLLIKRSVSQRAGFVESFPTNNQINYIYPVHQFVRFKYIDPVHQFVRSRYVYAIDVMVMIAEALI